jgi:putative nucleotidyltransferase with HDIG domain
MSYLNETQPELELMPTNTFVFEGVAGILPGSDKILDEPSSPQDLENSPIGYDRTDLNYNLNIGLVNYLIDVEKIEGSKEKQVFLLEKLGQHHPTTLAHSMRVGYMMCNFKLVAAELGIDIPYSYDEMFLAGLFHDLGKLLTKVEILDAPRKLTEEERLEINRHPLHGAALVQAAGLPKAVVDGARAHHQKMNGKGYPELKPGELPPEIARILGPLDEKDARRAKGERKYLAADINAADDQRIIDEINDAFEDGLYDQKYRVVFNTLYQLGRYLSVGDIPEELIQNPRLVIEDPGLVCRINPAQARITTEQLIADIDEQTEMAKAA